MHEVSDAPTVGGAAYETIRNDIIFGRLEPGAKLRLEGVKKRYNTSISTLREALSRLAMEGLVRAQDQRGFFVAEISAGDFREIADIRALLERHALKKSVSNGNTDWEGRVVAAHHKLSRMEQRIAQGAPCAQTIETWKRYDWEFHQALISACGSDELLALHENVFDKYLRYQMRALTHRGEAAAQEHRGLLEMALRGDAAGAQDLLERHILNGVEHSIASGDI